MAFTDLSSCRSTITIPTNLGKNSINCIDTQQNNDQAENQYIDPPQAPPSYEECIKEWTQSIKNSNLNCNGAEIIVH